MLPEDVCIYYKSNWTTAMRKLKMGVNTYQGWVRAGYIPMHTQLRIEKVTKGKLKSDLTLRVENEQSKLGNDG